MEREGAAVAPCFYFLISSLPWYIEDVVIIETILGRNRLPFLKISFDGEKELVDEYALEGGYIVLPREHQHGLFVVD